MATHWNVTLTTLFALIIVLGPALPFIMRKWRNAVLGKVYGALAEIFPEEILSGDGVLDTALSIFFSDGVRITATLGGRVLVEYGRWAKTREWFVLNPDNKVRLHFWRPGAAVKTVTVLLQRLKEERSRGARWELADRTLVVARPAAVTPEIDFDATRRG